MTESTETRTIGPCMDIARVRLDSERRSFDKVAHQSAFATFNNWASHEARRLCQSGSCVTGTCRGHVDVTDWRVVEESDERFTCEFSVEFFCRCD